MQTLAGRTCLFSGATSGDGVETVRQLCKGGMNVVMMTHNPGHAKAIQEEIEAAGYPGKAVWPGGLSDSEMREGETIYDAVMRQFGSIDVVICNTGANGHIDTLETVDPDQVLKNMSNIVCGALRSIQTALPYLRKSKGPRIILMTTTDAIRGGTYESIENAIGKGAVLALCKTAAAHLASEGITVNCIAKGSITRVEGIREGTPDLSARLPVIPLGRIGNDKDMADTICFIASEESSYITGQVFELNGGLNLGR